MNDGALIERTYYVEIKNILYIPNEYHKTIHRFDTNLLEEISPIVLDFVDNPFGITAHQNIGKLFTSVSKIDNLTKIDTIKVIDTKNDNKVLSEFKTDEGSNLLLCDDEYLYAISNASVNIYQINNYEFVGRIDVPNKSYEFGNFPQSVNAPAGVIYEDKLNQIKRIYLLNCDGTKGELITIGLS